MICENCGKEHNGEYASGRFCCKKCAKSFSTKDIKNKYKQVNCIICGKSFFVNIHAPNKYKCKECNNKKKQCNIFNIECDNCYFKINNICKSKSGIKYKLKTLEKYCDFTITNYENTLKNYLDLKNIFQNLIDSGLSASDICTIFFNNPKHGNTIFSILNVKGRNLSESVRNAFLQGKLGTNVLKSQYNTCWHTTWNNKEFFLRSSYELDYAKELDEQKIDYNVEYLRIKYWDSQKQKYRCAIPDFYIPSENMIVEIKSFWTLDEQNMKDKKKAYLDLGYNFKLICDHKEIIL